MREIWIFVRALAHDWVGRMSGFFGLLWTFATLANPGVNSRWFLALCLIALFVACFRVWQEMYREARPYDQETFDSVRTRFAAITDEARADLRRIVVEKSVPANSLSSPALLEHHGFVHRDMAIANYSLNPELAAALRRLVSEDKPPHSRRIDLPL